MSIPNENVAIISVNNWHLLTLIKPLSFKLPMWNSYSGTTYGNRVAYSIWKICKTGNSMTLVYSGVDFFLILTGTNEGFSFL